MLRWCISILFQFYSDILFQQIDASNIIDYFKLHSGGYITHWQATYESAIMIMTKMGSWENAPTVWKK